jgi:hypothetical protein
VLPATKLSTVRLVKRNVQKVDYSFALEDAKTLHKELKGCRKFTLHITKEALFPDS